MANSRAWLDLRGDDVLYVEGAEDFDITGAEHGEAVQVKASVGGVSHTPEWNEWMSQLETGLGAPLGETAARARDYPGGWIDGMLGSLNILLSEESSPEDLFLAQAHWLASMSLSPWLRETAAMFYRMVESAWLRITQTPAILRQPSVNIPAIQHACNHGTPSLRKAVQILEAAIPGVSTRLSDEMKAIIRSVT
jgi:hypothetical protein